MQILERLGSNDFEEVWEIMEASFPISEHRSREEQRKLLEEDTYRLYGIRQDKKCTAFLAVWMLENFCFVEHFAVSSSVRNQGMGAAILQHFLKETEEQVILEVELPKTELSKRRIRFYERNGFYLNEYPYMQPALSKDGGEIPLLLMSTSGKLFEKQFVQIRRELYEKVYKTNIAD